MATEQGIVRFEAGEATHTLVFGINALCALEDEFDCSVQEIGSKLSGGGKPVRMKDLRAIFRAGLIEGWPSGGMINEEPTHDDAGRIMTLLGPKRATELVGEAFVAAFPDAVEGKPGVSSGKATKK